MKVKNVINSLSKYYSVEELNIIGEEKKVFSGNIKNRNSTNVDMILYKKEIDNMEVKKRMIFHNKVFIFI